MVAQGWVIAAVCAAVVIIALALLVVWLVRRNGRQSDELNAAHAGRADAESRRADSEAARRADAQAFVAAEQGITSALARSVGALTDDVRAALKGVQSISERCAIIVALEEHKQGIERRDNGTE